MAQRRLFAIALTLTTACAGSSQMAAETKQAAETTAEAVKAEMVEKAPAKTNLKNLVAVIPVKDHAAATAWYKKWIGRDADAAPAEGVAEWKLAGDGWLQVALDPENAGNTTVVVGVNDLDTQRTACAKAGVTAGEVQDYGVVKLVEAVDPDGNKVAFVQETGAPPTGKTNLKNVVAVVPVKDHAAATAWYKKWIGRDADSVPMEGIAEWKLAGGGWLQVTVDPAQAGNTSVVVGVEDVAAQRMACAKSGVTAGDIQDYGVVKLVEAKDPDGNKVVFVQETAPASTP